MSGRFPGANNLETFWHNLQSGISGGRLFSSADDGLVHYGFPLDDIDAFDAAFFDVPPREAKLLDPQHRQFLECAYHALEHAGIAPRDSKVLTGIFASCNCNGYILPLADHLRHAAPVELVDMLAASDKDYLTARVAYKLNLKGPALNVQCACSSSLACVVMACQSILTGQCDMALAGGVGLKLNESKTYQYEPEGPLSKDGHIRAYSDDASGVNEGEGVGVVVLKRLEDALRDGNTVYAVICGYALGNDGADKTGFYAPSVSGQADVMADALAMSGVDPLEIGHVEGHGTGTLIGDPMEVAALTQAWNLPGDAPRQYCFLGSVKTGIGHTNSAAGIASLIKTVLALHHGVIPASLDFNAPNPRLSLESTPFRVAAKSCPWNVPPGKTRKAAVNSLGIGGNNVHMILEEGPHIQALSCLGPALATLSAKTRTALDSCIRQLAEHLKKQPVPSLADVAHTLLMGRDMHKFRLSLVSNDAKDLADTLQSTGILRKITELDDPDKVIPTAFLFPGFGSQHVEMGLELREKLPAFKEVFDRLHAAFKHEAGVDVLSALASENSLKDALIGTCALFAVSYSLAKTLIALGVEPSYVMGHSAGEYVAATLAGVYSEKDAVRLLAERSRIIGGSPQGGMLFVPMGCEALQPRLPEDVSIGVVIGPDGCVASGAVQGIERLEALLRAENISFLRIQADRAGHSPLLESAMPRLRKAFEGVTLRRPSIPILSNVTGTWLSDTEATDPGYWVRQMREPVRLSGQLFELCNTGNAILLEVGPSRKLSAMLRRHPALKGRHPIVPTMPAEQASGKETAALLEGLGRLWQEGGKADWKKVDFLNGSGRTVALPTYPFERQRFWLDHDDQQPAKQQHTKKNIETTAVCWKQMLLGKAAPTGESIAILGEQGRDIAVALEHEGWHAKTFPALEDLTTSDDQPDILVDCRFLHEDEDSLDGADHVCRQALPLCAWLAERASGKTLNVYWAVSGAAAFGKDIPRFNRTALLAPARILPFEAKNVLSCVLDVEKNLSAKALVPIFAAAFANRLAATALTSLVAVRAGMFWQESPACLPLPQKLPETVSLRTGAAYLVLGGSGGIGLTFMKKLASLAAEQKRQITLLPVQRQIRHADFWKGLLNDWVRVIPFSQELGDPEHFISFLDSLENQYGPIAGVIHASGVTGGGLMQVQSGKMTNKVECTENWRAKVAPLPGLERLLHKGTVDFIILNSSIGSLCGAVGQMDNTVANIMLDTWACRIQACTPAKIRSIRWDVWREVGMINKMADLHERLAGEKLKGGITPKEAMQALDVCLAGFAGLPAVCGRNLGAMLEETREKRGFAADALEMANLKAQKQGAPRPPMSVEWRGARHVLDRALLGLFENRLGLAGIGIDDDYVELGGDSLMGLPLAKEIRELFDCSGFSVARIFRYRTVANIADALGKNPEEKERLFLLAELLESVRNMTPEEVAEQLEGASL
ncbi:beta-ketoacyl synthase N-terminal-like domain-containing protein [uncultured Desulfovibrio sp.]|uniref:type I polyketide synthase n=1 Tax=uncultured Desulfovibrio sp. TaxID=167968 RepID=UPI00260E1E92|nr:beta-ketoacyl synthase N-terminal-like domain-containing protein [uncultured Desulfovibrio sp.]